MFAKVLSDTYRAPGQQVTVFGGFFDGSCKVFFDNDEAVILDYDEERIVAQVPFDYGVYSVKVQKGSQSVVLGELVVKELSKLPQHLPKRYSEDSFFNYIVGMFPRGKAFALRKSSNFGKLISVFAFVLFTVWESIRELLVQSSPSHTTSFDEWESDLGLPIDGIDAIAPEERLAEIYRVACLQAGDTIPYFYGILTLLGVEAEIYEYWKNPGEFSGYNFDPSDDKNFFWKVNVHADPDNFKTFVSGSSAGEALIEWTDTKLETLFNLIKPAHTRIVYGYDDGIMTGYLLDENGNHLTDEEGHRLYYTTKKWG